MKKSSISNLITIIGLLVVCVLTLLAIYATTPDSTVLLFDENFNVLDENKWKQQVSECKDGKEYNYGIEDGGNSEMVSDGVLRLLSNYTQPKKRELRQNCSTCSKAHDSTLFDCVSFSAHLQTKNSFQADSGQIKLRVRILFQEEILFYIGMSSEENFLNATKFSNISRELYNSNSSDFVFFFNDNILKSEVTDNNYHIYEINWNNETITLSVDGNKVDERRMELSQFQNEMNNNSTDEFEFDSVSLPFYLTIGSKKEEINSKLFNKRSVNNDPKKNNEESTGVVEVDYIQLFEIFNR